MYLSWYGKKKASKIKKIDHSRILIFDTETTGLSPTMDEIIQITILNGRGDRLFSSYIKPVLPHPQWKIAERTHHISKKMVEDAPKFKDVRREIQELFNNAQLVVGYNVNFDLQFIESAGIIVSGKIFDVMTEFAKYTAETTGRSYRNYKLSFCASHYGYSFNEHNSEDDAKATLFCFDRLINEQEFTEVKQREHKEITETNKCQIKPGIQNRQQKTRKRHPIIWGCVFLIVGFVTMLLWSGENIISVRQYFKILETAFQHLTDDRIALLICLSTILGVLKVFLRVVVCIIRIPKWFYNKASHAMNSLK